MHPLRRAVSSVVVLAVLMTASAAAAQTRPAIAPLSPPSLFPQGPFAKRAPLTFYWSPVAPGPGYRINVSGAQRAMRATALVAVRYELQISAVDDVNFAYVLYDRIVDSTSLLFVNDGLTDPGFTSHMIPTHPLSAGTYNWRVRALAGEPLSPSFPLFSQYDRFTLDTGVTTNPLHDLSVSAISVAGRPAVGRSTPIVVRVSNIGTFAESGATLAFTADGQRIGTAPICGAQLAATSPRPCRALDPGAYVDVAVPWTPSAGPLAALTAQVQGVDEDARNNTVTQSIFVASETPVRTTVAGVLVPHKSGIKDDFALAESSTSSQIAAVLGTRNTATIDFSRFLYRRVEVDGSLRANQGGLLLDAITAIREVVARLKP